MYIDKEILFTLRVKTIWPQISNEDLLVLYYI